MGEETMEFATRFSRAVSHLALVASGDALPAAQKAPGAELARSVGEALDAVEAVYGTGTEAVRDWPEKGQAVLAQVGALRRALAGGATADVRRAARDLVLLVDPRALEASRRSPPSPRGGGGDKGG